MPPSWIIEPIDVLEYRPFSLASGFPSVAPDQLCYDGRKEQDHYKIIVAIFFYAQTLLCLHASKDSFDTRANGIAIRVMDAALRRQPMGDC